MAQKSVLYNIFNDLSTAMKTIVSSKYIFLKNRPKITESDSPMSKFVVIDLPVSIDDYVIGGKKTLLNTTGVFYLFTQARKNGTLDIGSSGDLVDEVESLFPIKGEYVNAVNPSVSLRGSDEQGFQVSAITFDLQSKWKVFNKNQ